MMGHLAYFFGRKTTILAIQAGAVLLLVSTAFTWVEVDQSVGAATGGDSDVLSLRGGELSPVVQVIGVVAVIAGLLLSITTRWVRGVLGALLLGGGLIALLAGILMVFTPEGVLEFTGAAEGPLSGDDYSVGLAAWLGVLGGLLVTVGAMAVLLFSPGWDDEPDSRKA